MSRRQTTIRVGLEKKSSSRRVLPSLDIPQSPSSRITICSQPRPCAHSEPHQSGELSVASSYRELFCTTQTCSNSQSCVQTCPDICPHGLKEAKNEGTQCSKSCHSHITKTSSTKIKATFNTSYDCESNSSNSCPATVSITSVRQSSSLARLLSSCFNSNKSDSPPVNSPERCPSATSTSKRTDLQMNKTESPSARFCCPRDPSASPTAATKPIRHDNLGEKIKNVPSDSNISCCEASEAHARARGAPVGSSRGGKDAGTHPIPKTTATGTCMSSTPEPGIIKYASDILKEDEVNGTKNLPLKSPSGERMDCCPPPQPPSSVTDPRKKSPVRTTFKDPEVESESPKTLVKVSSVREDLDKENTKQKKDPCTCSETELQPKVQKKCSCHFPPAFNQYGCTGNITGSCNCASDD